MRRIGLVVTVVSLSLALPTVVSTAPAPTEYFIAILTADESVPRVTSRAHGQAVFEFNPAANTVAYWLTVMDIENLDMGHIHIGPRGQAGPVAVWLYPPGPPPRRIAGVTSGDIASGTITAANLVGPLARQPITALVTAMRDGNAYVNLHTARNPASEIRGQIAR